MTACRSNLMLSARSQTRGPINFLGSQKGPALSAGPRWGRHVTRLAESLGGEFPAPARVPKSGLWNWFHHVPSAAWRFISGLRDLPWAWPSSLCFPSVPLAPHLFQAAFRFG